MRDAVLLWSKVRLASVHQRLKHAFSELRQIVEESQRSRFTVVCLFVSVCLWLLGCGSRSVLPSGPINGTKMYGRVFGGEQPVVGSSVQLYAAAANGSGTSSTPLLKAAVSTDSSGGFTITGEYTCPSPDTLVYLVGVGGNPGLPGDQTNAALSLMAALGPCGNLAPSTFISLNEATTVASVFPLAPFTASYISIGAAPSEMQTLADAFTVVGELVNISTGSIAGTQASSGYFTPGNLINTLANLIATCVNSAGGRAGDGTSCGRLFAAVQQPGELAPSDTIGALLDIARHPASGVSTVFNLVPASGPYQPSLTSAPASWAVSLQPTPMTAMPESNSMLGQYLLQEGTGSTATDTSGSGNDGTIVGATWESSVDLNFAQGAYISLPASLNAANTWQFAIYSPPFGSGTYPLPPGVGDRSAFGLNPSLLCGTDQAHTCLIAGSYPGTVSQRFWAYNTSGTQSAQALTAGWHIVTLVGGQNGSLDRYFYDGKEVSYAFQSSGAFSHPSTGSYQIGGSYAYTGSWFTGKIAGAWAWSSSLTPGEVVIATNLAQNYLRSKGVGASIGAADHTTPLIIGGIDSRTEGGTWLYQLSVDPSFGTLNLGAYGATLYDTDAMYDLLDGPQILGNTAPTIVLYWGGVNDFSAYIPASVASGSLRSLVIKAKAEGAKVIVATEISSVVSDSEKAAFDDLVRANALSWGADNVADLATIPQLGADGAYANQSYFIDGVHPSAGAEPLIAGVFSNAINELLGSTSTSPHLTSLSTYREVAGDRFLRLTGTTLQTITLPSCTGYALPRQVANSGALPATLQTQGGETLQGAGILAVGQTAVVTPVPGPYATGGCSWQQTLAMQ